jgi:hypothetical protein
VACRTDDLSAPAAGILRQLPDVADVEVLVTAPNRQQSADRQRTDAA